MPFQITKTNRITSETTYYVDETHWSGDANDGTTFATENEANTKNSELNSKGFSGTVSSC